MYRTGPQIVFQFVGGFATAQYTYPILFKASELPDATSSDKSGASYSSISIPYVGTVSTTWKKVKESLTIERFTTPPTLSEDVERLLLSYRALSVILVSLVVVAGGAPSVIGAGISIYYDGSRGGAARYKALKKKWRELNKR